MPSTLLTNAEIREVIGGIPSINASNIGEDTLDVFVAANDLELIERFGAHPADTDSAEYAARRLALCNLVAIDLFNQGDLTLRQRWLSRVGAYGGQQ